MKKTVNFSSLPGNGRFGELLAAAALRCTVMKKLPDGGEGYSEPELERLLGLAGNGDSAAHKAIKFLAADFISAGANMPDGLKAYIVRDLFSSRNKPRSRGKNPYDNTFRMVSSPGVAPGTIVIPTCKKGPVIAFKVNDALQGTITEPNGAYRWTFEKTPDVPIPLIHDGLVYLCMADGKFACIDLESGEQQYFERGHNSQHRSSPLYVDGHIYTAGKDGMVVVRKAGRKYEVVSENSMNGEGVTASPIVANGTLYIRSAQALYAIKSPK